MGGRLVNGEWKTQEQFADDDGNFRREDSGFRDWITPTGENAPSDKKAYPAQKGRYHLYVSLACPWAHRTLIMRHLKNLQDYIDVSIVHPHMLDKGWSFDDDFDFASGDKLYDLNYMHELYTKAKNDYSGKVTVPALWDKETHTIVNNESADILRIFNEGFNELTGNKDDYYPPKLKSEIDKWNELIYDNINNGVYKTGFATKQNVYEKECEKLFEALEEVEAHLSDGKTYMMGSQLTETDIRLFTTLIRFDSVYYVHFKCNKKRICDYKQLSKWLQNLYGQETFYKTVNFPHIKHHYYYSHKDLNPHQIIPLGPEKLFEARQSAL
jgi:putative glutathione S-transferase